MLKRLNVWFTNFTYRMHGVGFFDVPKYQVPPLKVDRSFKAKQFLNTGNNSYGKNRYSTKKPPVQRARGLIKQRPMKKAR